MLAIDHGALRQLCCADGAMDRRIAAVAEPG
jgi:hypothetical protein